MNPLLTNEIKGKSIKMRFEDCTSALKMLFIIIFMSFMQAGPARMMKRKNSSNKWRVARPFG